MSQFKIIKSEEIEKALSKTSRQYLVGNLSKPQILENVQSEKLEKRKKQTQLESVFII